MSQLPLCPHCLEPVRSGYHGSCPNCGKSLENHNPEGALPLGTQLGGHYTVGEYQRRRRRRPQHAVVDNDERRFVLIKEYFGNAVQWPQPGWRPDAQRGPGSAVQNQPDGFQRFV